MNRNKTLVRVIGFCILFISATIVNGQSVVIKPKIIRDLSGYWVHGGGGNSPKKWFDGYGSVDPKNGITTFPASNRADTTYALPFRNFPDYYYNGVKGDSKLNFKGKRGLRMIFDMSGDKDALKPTRYKITDIYAWDMTWFTGDSLFFYNFDKVLELPVEERWKYLARPDSLLTPFAALVTDGGGYTNGKWINITCNDTMRYIMVRAVLKDRAGTSKSFPAFSELVMYGNYVDSSTTVSPRPDQYTGPLPAKLTFDKFTGVNQGTYMNADVMAYDHNIRMYESVSYYDKDMVDYPANKYLFNPWGLLPPLLEYPVTMKQQGKFMWASIRGGSHYLAAQNNGDATKIINTNKANEEPESPYSYSRSGDFFYNYAAKYGSVAVPAANTRWTNDAGYPNGLNFYNSVENGNEDDFWGQSILGYLLKSFVDYDGWEGRVGSNLGVKAADPNFNLIMSASAYMDSNRIDSYVWLSKILRTDGKFPFSVINFHHYSRTYNNAIDYVATAEQQIGEKGESAERDLIYDKLNSYTNAVYNVLDGDTTVKIFLTEWGYDNFPQAPPNLSAIDIPWTTSGTPIVTGYDNVQSKAIIMARGESIMAATGFRGYNEYMIHNVFFGPNEINMLFATCGRTTGGVDAPQKFPFFFYRAGMFEYLKNYYVDEVISKNGENLWILKWKNKNQPDSLCYEVWKGSYNGTNLPNQSINIGSVVGNTAKRVELSFTQVMGTETTVPAAGGFLTVKAFEKPFFYFVKQDTLAIVNQLPVANAGADQTHPNIVSVNLNGTSSYDPDGTIAAYQWLMIAGPGGVTMTTANQPNASANFTQAGTYIFQLAVTDDKGAIAYDEVTITVGPPPNQLPVANAGPDQNIFVGETAALNGTASADPDGTITQYSWIRISGPGTASINNAATATPNVPNLVLGLHTFRLTVTDNRGGTATDDVIVNVAPRPNQLPIANAGPDQNGFNGQTINLNGTASSDPDGTITQYSWIRVAGPGSATITNSNTATPSVIGLSIGAHTFRLTVTDNGGATATDDVIISIAQALNQPPVARAGNDTTVAFPSTTARLNGTASYDADGSITSYSWRQIGGQATATVSNAMAATASLTQLITGDYIFELTVTDDKGATARDTVKISVVNLLRYTGALKIYPNPVATETVTLDGFNDYTGKAYITILDVSGKLIRDESFEKTGTTFRHSLDVSRLSAGTYILRIKFYGTDAVSVYKIVKQ